MGAIGEGSDYRVIETLGETGGEHLYRAHDRAGRSVVLKVLDGQGARAKALERLENEFRIAAKVGTRAVVRPIALERFHGAPALVLEDVAGRTLDHVVDGPIELGRFLRLAVAAATALEDVHRHGVIHKDLKPPNLLVEEATDRVRISGFGSASLRPREQQAVCNPNQIEGTLAYMSPEQTGRMHRALDSRTDLYSLGVTFYEMLTGQLPFHASDALGWVHCHIARCPPPPSVLVPRLPQTVSAIVMKLLAKPAEDRYQSAAGLRFDLECCQRQWAAFARVDPFPLATRDVWERLQIPEKLFGREREREALRAAFAEVVASGGVRLVLLAGEAGVGKSSLGHELEATLIGDRGIYLAGEFDPYQRNVPHGTLVEALRGLLADILGESDAEIAAWRQRLSTALGANAQLMIDLLPALELVLGKQPPAAALAARDAQLRFSTILQRLIGALPHRDRPVVMFLDDLQWADAASLETLQRTAADPEVGPMLIVGTYRSDEPDPGLVRAVEALRRSGVGVDEVRLGPLTIEDLAGLVGETLHCPPAEAASLAVQVHEKTGGNPFFAGQFLVELWQEGLLVLDRESHRWQWFEGEIAAKGFTSNVVDFMVTKVRRLPAETQAILRLAACLGRPFDVNTLAAVAGEPEGVTEAGLLPAVGEGLILYSDGLHRFAHDRIREAAYQLLGDHERAATHLRIARWLLADRRPAEMGDEVFDAANQINRGASLISDERERVQMAEANLVAGRRALATHAPGSAVDHLSAGLALLGTDPWESHHRLAHQLTVARAECWLLRGDPAAALRDSDEAIRRADTPGEQAAPYRFRQDALMAQGRLLESAEAGLERLELFGIALPRHPTREDVLAERERIRRLMDGRPIEALVDLPPMRDPDREAALGGAPLVAAVDPALFALHAARMVSLTLEHGLADASAQWFSTWAFALAAYLDEPVEGARLARLARELVDRRRDGAYKPAVYLASALVHFWIDPADEYCAHANAALEAAQAAGASRDANYASMLVVRGLLAKGEPLDRVEREAAHRLDQMTFEDARDNTLLFQQFARAMRGRTASLATLSDDSFDETRLSASDGQPAHRTADYWVAKLRAAFLARDLDAAWLAAEQARPLAAALGGQIACRDYHLYRALTLAARCDAASPQQREGWLIELREHERRLRRWAGINPRTFRPNLALVSAELARLGLRFEEAARLYDDSAHWARQGQLVHDEALAYELGARFYRAQGLETLAEPYLRAARDAYARWGATGKVTELAPPGSALATGAEGAHPPGSEAFAMSSDRMDVLSVVKASQAISGEVVQDQLLARLMEVVLEHGGADRACVLMPGAAAGALAIAAEARVQGADTRTELPVVTGQPVSAQELPLSLLQYVSRTNERLVLADATTHPRFMRDEYVIRARPRSVTCLPVRRTTELVGILYLENRSLAGAFTPARLTILELLAAQAAISLDHARLLRQEQLARAAAEQAGGRLATLAEVSLLLTESLDLKVVLSRITAQVVTHVGELCMIDLLDGTELRRMGHAHRDPAKQEILRELSERYPVRQDSMRAPAQVVRTGKPLFYPGGSRQYAEENAIDDEHRRLLVTLDSQGGVILPLVTRGRILGCMSVAASKGSPPFDENTVKLLEEIARRAAGAIDNAQLHQRTEEAVRARDEFLHVASHELNTPLAALLLNLDAIKTLPADYQADFRLLESMASVAHRQGLRLSRLVRELLDATRIERGHLILRLEPIELGALVREAVAIYGPELAQAGCHVRLAQAAPVNGRWDAQRFNQVVLNLLSNAAKFAPGKPIEIAIEAPDAAGLARLSVTDHGIGLPAGGRARLFERYQRGVSAEHYGGLGLGLHICKHIIEAHGGRIWVESEEGKGATFKVEMPCSPGADTEA